jgi:hypothetical protein
MHRAECRQPYPGKLRLQCTLARLPERNTTLSCHRQSAGIRSLSCLLVDVNSKDFASHECHAKVMHRTWQTGARSQKCFEGSHNAGFCVSWMIKPRRVSYYPVGLDDNRRGLSSRGLGLSSRGLFLSFTGTGRGNDARRLPKKVISGNRNMQNACFFATHEKRKVVLSSRGLDDNIPLALLSSREKLSSSLGRSLHNEPCHANPNHHFASRLCQCIP